MARLPRVKDLINGAWHHVYASVAGGKTFYPLDDLKSRHKLIEIIKFYSHAYECGVASFNIMGNHYHLVTRFSPERELSPEELWARALKFYPHSERELEGWDESQWKRFQKRIFDVSEFMRNVQSKFANWYNKINGRKGHLWGDRFKSNLLADPVAVLECILYVELNSVRANKATQPEDYSGCSLFLREMGVDDWLLPLDQFYSEIGPRHYERFKELIYHRGAVPTKSNHKPISPEVIAREEAKGFARTGVYLKRLRYFTESVVLGSQILVQEKLIALRNQGFGLRKKMPLPVENGILFQLRGQRRLGGFS